MVSRILWPRRNCFTAAIRRGGVKVAEGFAYDNNLECIWFNIYSSWKVDAR